MPKKLMKFCPYCKTEKSLDDYFHDSTKKLSWRNL